MINEEIREKLYDRQDLKYRDFQAKLIPGMETEKMIGVRTPDLRKIAKQMVKREDIGEFLENLPHEFFDENQVHAFVISELKDYGRCVQGVERFLPFVDNWATCDQMSPKVFKKHRPELLDSIKEWIRSEHTYTVRFAVGMLMQHYLDEDFDPEYPEMVAEVQSEEYYIRMMIAWYFATALAKQYEAVLPYIEERRLEPWTHNKTIQKAVESYRITPEQKEYLKSLEIYAQLHNAPPEHCFACLGTRGCAGIRFGRCQLTLIRIPRQVSRARLECNENRAAVLSVAATYEVGVT